MGNRQSRSKSTSDMPDPSGKRRGRGRDGGSQRGGTGDVTNSSKHLSMPELGGAVPYKGGGDPGSQDKPVKVKIHRSYRDLQRSKSSVDERANEKVDYKLYRRNAPNWADKPRTLPRNFGRSKSSAAGYAGRSGTYTPNGSIDPGFPGLDPRDVSTAASKLSFRSSKRASRASSINSAVSQVSPADFPSTPQIRHKLQRYEECYIEILTQKFRQLSPDTQCERLVIARDTASFPPRREDFAPAFDPTVIRVKNRRVSLKEYMSEETPVPCDLLTGENRRRYRLCIPEPLFYGIRHVRAENKSRDVTLMASLARDVVTCIATEAANELTRIYEYQIALMFDDMSIRILADHATECVLEYIQGHYIDRNSAIRSVVQVYPPNPDGIPKLISGVIGTKELKWDLFEIYKQPGLRKELLLVSDECIGESGIDYQPWQYFFSPDDTSPFLYGYRGQMIEWDFIESGYKLDMKENSKFGEEIAYQVEDYHRLYMPYKRLVGAQVMERFTSQENTDGKKSLTDMIRVDPLEGPPEREEITAVYRPIATQAAPIKYGGDGHMINLDNIDMTRAQLADTDLSNTTVQNSKLLMANLDKTKLGRANLAGSDLSYCNMESSDISPDTLKHVTVKHVMLNGSFSSPEGPQSPASPVTLAGVVEREGEPYGPDGIEDALADALPGRTSVVSDRQGNIMHVSNAISQHRSRIADEEREQAEEEERVRIRLESSPLVTSTPAESAGKRKKRKKKKRVEELAGTELNHSVESTGQASLTDYNFLDDRTPARPPPHVTNGNSHIINDDQVNSFFTSADQSSSPSDRVDAAHTPGKPRTTAVTRTHTQQTPPRGGEAGSLSRPANGASTEDILRPRHAHQTLYQAEPRSVSSGNILEESRPIQSRHSNVEKRAHRPAPQRMVKAQSHHGQLTHATDTQNNNLSQRLSTGDGGEHFRRSQVFRMLADIELALEGLQIAPLPPRVPARCSPLLGRTEEITDITELLGSSGRLITLTGCPGVGKSQLAIAVATEMTSRHVTPVYIDASACTSVDSLIHRTMAVFGLKFRDHELPYFYNWVNSHEQRLMFVLDNLELAPSEDNAVSGFLDNLLFNIKNLRLLSTCHRHFFRGQSSHEIYRVGDIRGCSEKLLEAMLPDCHQEGISDLASSVDHVLFGLHLCGRAFSITDVDSGKLFEDLTSGKCDLISTNRLEAAISRYTTNEIEQQRLYKVGLVIGSVIEHLPVSCQSLLSVCHVIPSSFSVDTCCKLCGVNAEAAASTLTELVRVGLVVQSGGENKRYHIPKFVELVFAACWPDDGTNMLKITKYYVDLITELNAVYHSSHAYTAVWRVWAEYDNIVSTLTWLLEREDVYESCRAFADVEYAIFLSETLPQGLYDDLYDNITQQAGDNSDAVTRVNALCCSAYRCLRDSRTDNARAYADNAYDSLQAVKLDEIEKAFCMQCLGRCYWQDSDLKDKGLTLVKCALDIYKSKYGLKHVKALYANEEYGKLLTAKDSHQKARHIFNVSDLLLTDLLNCHPMLIPGYDCRRSIWDKLCLFSRSTEIAQKAVDTALCYYGDHPVTADMMTSLCECIMKRGSLQDGIKVCVSALRMRLQVLGDHTDTGVSYRMLAYLMQRSGQHDEAVRFAQSGLEVYDKIDAPEKYKIDVKNIIAQARYRLDNRASVYVEIDSKNASKTNIADNNANIKIRPNNNIVVTTSTEV